MTCQSMGAGGSVAAIQNGSERTQVRNAMKRLRNFGKFHVPDTSPLNLCSSPLLHKVAKAQYGQTCQALEWVEATLTRGANGFTGTLVLSLGNTP